MGLLQLSQPLPMQILRLNQSLGHWERKAGYWELHLNPTCFVYAWIIPISVNQKVLVKCFLFSLFTSLFQAVTHSLNISKLPDKLLGSLFFWFWLFCFILCSVLGKNQLVNLCIMLSVLSVHENGMFDKQRYNNPVLKDLGKNRRETTKLLKF